MSEVEETDTIFMLQSLRMVIGLECEKGRTMVGLGKERGLNLSFPEEQGFLSGIELS